MFHPCLPFRHAPLFPNLVAPTKQPRLPNQPLTHSSGQTFRLTTIGRAKLERRGLFAQNPKLTTTNHLQLLLERLRQIKCPTLAVSLFVSLNFELRTLNLEHNPMP